MQATTMANILKDAKIVKNEAKAIEVQEKDNHNYSTIINGSEHQTFIERGHGHDLTMVI